MEDSIYPVIVIVVAALTLMAGYRRGFTRQISGLLGVAFGAVCSNIFKLPAEEALHRVFPGIAGVPFPGFVYSVLASVIVYVIVYFLFRFLSGVLRSAVSVFHLGMLDRLVGAFFNLFKYMIALSIIFNLILCVKPESGLLNYANANDGNIVEAVLMLAPSMLGCDNVEDLFHMVQLREAKKISFNFQAPPNVILENYEIIEIETQIIC